ncbi:MAG TPA: rod shape-determining protein MreD [Bacteroidota bacterium]|nr:rod shape-determining protein MreD [Bacteroidota bacterium]
MRLVVRYCFISLGLIVLQTTVVRFMAIETIVPDLLLIWIVALALVEGQATAVTAGFCLGLAMDLLSGHDGMLGLAALSKTIAGFVAGFFHDDNRVLPALGGYQFPLFTAIAAVVHNLVYFAIYLQGSDITMSNAVVVYGIPSTGYTVALSLIPMMVFARRARVLI